MAVPVLDAKSQTEFSTRNYGEGYYVLGQGYQFIQEMSAFCWRHAWVRGRPQTWSRSSKALRVVLLALGFELKFCWKCELGRNVVWRNKKGECFAYSGIMLYSPQ